MKRTKHRNPFEISDKDSDALILELQERAVSSYPGPNYLKSFIQRTETMLPDKWGVLWIPTSKTTGKFKHESGITLYYYKVIAIFHADQERAIQSLLHELWHARSLDTYGYQKYVDNYMYWSELDADLYAMKVLYRDPISPYYHGIDMLLANQLSKSVAYGVQHLAKSLIRDGKHVDKIKMPTRWKFLVPLIKDAMLIGPDDWESLNWREKLKYIPYNIIKNYTDLITR